jgi:hypothetical protein
MTRLEVEVGEVVLRGLPASYGAGFGPLVEQRLGDLARGADGAVEDLGPEDALANQVARQIWNEVRRSTHDVWGDRR